MDCNFWGGISSEKWLRIFCWGNGNPVFNQSMFIPSLASQHGYIRFNYIAFMNGVYHNPVELVDYTLKGLTHKVVTKTETKT